MLAPKISRHWSRELFAFEVGPAEHLDAVVAAAILAFGFAYAHPFEDGNGRVHRYLIHHVLSKRNFNPPELAFPVSAAILGRLEDYRRVLEDATLPKSIKLKPCTNGALADRHRAATPKARLAKLAPHGRAKPLG